METRKTTKRYPAELRERAVRLVREQAAEHGSQWSAIRSIAEKVGCNAETLRLWVRRSERDRGARPGLTTDERDECTERDQRDSPGQRIAARAGWFCDLGASGRPAAVAEACAGCEGGATASAGRA